jgi:SNF2-related domain/Helicase conserved C-terminal domain
MWLFRRPLIEQAVKHLKAHTQVARAIIISANELEVYGEVGKNNQTFNETRLRLKLAENGDLHLTTECTCHSRNLCDHAAAVMMVFDQESERILIEKIAKPGLASVAESGVGGIAAGEEKATAVSNDELHPVLKLRRLSIERQQLKAGRSSLLNSKLSIGIAEPWVKYVGCPETFQLLGRGRAARWKNESGEWFTLSRNMGLERLLLAELNQAGLIPLSLAIPDGQTTESVHVLMSVPETKQAVYWSAFLRDQVPLLEENGWQLEISEDFGYKIVQAAEDAWYTDLENDAAGRDHFSLDLGIELEGQRISLVPLLVDCIDQGLTPAVLEKDLDQQFLLSLPGTGNPVLSVPGRRLLVLLRFLDELLTTRPMRKDGKLHVDKLRAAQLSVNLEGLPIRAPVELAALQKRLAGFTEMSLVPLPAGLKADLRPYQLEGLSWLQFLREFGLHGILADDMGLGKTMQTLAHLLIEKEAGRMDRPSLILAPTSVIRNWARESAKFTPALSVLLLHGDDRQSDFSRITKHDLVVTSYPLIVRDADVLRAIDWHIVALDEAQNIKNPKSKAAQICSSLKARHRLCITGTPMENHLGELWSLYHFLMPGLLGDSESFREYYRVPIERDADTERQSQLNTRLQPLLLRRTKSAVAKDLPPKTEIIHRIDLDKTQSDLYETIRAAMDQRVREAISNQGLERSQIIVLDALLKLRQVCCHPHLLKNDTAKKIQESAKTAFLMEDLLPELIDEGHRVLIFSQFTEMLAILEAELEKANIRFVKLTGQTQDRETPMRQFQNGEVPVFLISLKAGGSGLTLTAADTVIHYDPWWNPAAEAQASDRAHRIGQTKPVFIHKLICQGTIEERILDMQKTKAALIEGLLSGRSEKLKLTQEDIQRLLTAS